MWQRGFAPRGQLCYEVRVTEQSSRSKVCRLAPRLAVLALALCSSGAAAPIYAQNFIGADQCKTCHAREYRIWSQGPHAKALDALTPAQRKDPKCNICHTMLPGDNDPRFAGIQCERCHGPGRYYHPEYVMRDKELSHAVGLVDPTPAHCQQCHTEGAPSVEPFNFDKMWKSISHGAPAPE